MHEIAAFLAHHAPFDVAGPDELEAIAATVEIDFHPAGSTVPTTDEDGDVVHVVRRGALELVEGARVVDVLQEGELAGDLQGLPGAPAGVLVRAREDTVDYRLRADAVRTLLERPEGLRWVARALGERRALRVAPSAAASLEPRGGPVRDLAREAILVDPATGVGELARRMGAEGATCVLIELSRGFGIVTDRDLRGVLAAGGGPDTPAAEAMTAPARAVSGDRPAEDVLLELLHLGVRHAPVVGPHGRLLGVITEHDLLAGGPLAPFVTRRAIERAPDREAALRAAARIPEAALALHAAHVDAATVGEVVAALTDALVRRLLALAEAELGRPPVPYAWYALGWSARREAALLPDGGGAVAWAGADDDPAARAYARALADRVGEDLERAALPHRGIGARSVDGWVRAIAELAEGPDDAEAARLVPVLVDGRAVVAGDGVAAAIAEALDAPEVRAGIARRLARLALRQPLPTGFAPDGVVEHDGTTAARLDLERTGLLPIVDLARALAVRAGHRPVSTPARLDAARDAGLLSTEDAAALSAAFDLLLALRLDHQAAQARAGVPPDALLDPAGLDTLTRALLREAFRVVERTRPGLAEPPGDPPS